MKKIFVMLLALLVIVGCSTDASINPDFELDEVVTASYDVLSLKHSRIIVVTSSEEQRKELSNMLIDNELDKKDIAVLSIESVVVLNERFASGEALDKSTFDLQQKVYTMYSWLANSATQYNITLGKDNNIATVYYIDEQVSTENSGVSLYYQFDNVADAFKSVVDIVENYFK